MLVRENKEEVNQRLDAWRLVPEEKALRINRSKIEYIKFKFDEREFVDESRSGMTVGREKVKEIECFKYLESFLKRNGGSDKDLKHRIRCG